MCIFLLTSMITGCSSGKIDLEVKNISSELCSEQISQENSSDISEQCSVDNGGINNENTIETTSNKQSQEDSSDISEQYSVNNGGINNKNTVETASNEQISQEDSSDVSKQNCVNDDVIVDENTTDLTIENSLNIIDIEQIEKEGGIVEFADIMTYGDFQNLGWTDDVDASLDKDEKVYIVKIYYPEGFEHYKVGKIENCEAIGIYSIDDGTYLGGCFREK